MIRRIVLVACAALLACGGGKEYGGSTGSSSSGGTSGGTDVIAEAPPVWQPEGTAASANGASFLAPAGWALTQYTDGAGVVSPKDSDGDQCEILVLQPRPTATGEEAQYQQVLDAARGMFPEGTVIENQYGGSDPLEDRWRGETGRGWNYVGLFLTTGNDTVDVLSFLADFSGTAVPVIVVEPRGSSWDCISVTGDFNETVATVFHTLKLDSAGETRTSALEQSVVGKWFSSDGSAGTQFIFGANGHYSDTSVYGGTVEVSPGDWEDQYATWSGDGSYRIDGDVVAEFPSDGAPEGHYIRVYEWNDPQNVWHRRLCWISEYEGNPFTLCLAHQDS